MLQKFHLSWKIALLGWFLALGTLLAQPPSPRQLSAVQDRVQELRRSGVPEERILEIIQEEFAPKGADQPPASQAPTAPQEPAPQASQESAGTPSSSPAAIPQDTPETELVPIAPDEPMEQMGEDDDSGIFGHSVFLRQPILDTTQRLTPPRGYIIGPGDVFTISIYGPSELFESLFVKEDGSIVRQSFGKIYLSGMTFESARDILERKYRTMVDNRSVIEIRLTPNPRTIGVNIVGEVPNPGFYQVPASMPAFRAIIQAGGVTNVGSVRNIQVKRNGKTVHVIDIYKYLLTGEYEQFYLQEDDFLFVPIQSKVVAIRGSVTRPMRYELREEENLQDLIRFAGGLGINAQRTSISLRRLETVSTTNASGPNNNRNEILLNLDLDEIDSGPLKDYQLFQGDQISVKNIRRETVNAVRIFGSIVYPDTYQLFEGERVTDLIFRSGGLSPDAYLDRAYVVRRSQRNHEARYIPINLRSIYPDSLTVIKDSPDNLALEFRDVVLIFSEYSFLKRRSLTVTGRVRKPGTYQIFPSMSLKDLLFIAGGLLPDAELNSIELSVVTEPEDIDIDNFGADVTNPMDPGELPDEEVAVDSVLAPLIRRVAIPENWQDDASLDTVMIFDFNRVKIYSRYDFIFTRDISVAGAVKNPGTFAVKRGMTLKDMLYLVGGLSEPSVSNEVELYRIIGIDEKGNFGTQTDRSEIVRFKLEGDWRESEIADTLEVTSFYRIVVRSETEFARKGYVAVKGLVNRPGTYEVLPGMSLRDVLFMAGGLVLESDADQIEMSRIINVLAPSGELVPTPVDIRRVSTRQDWQSDPALEEIKIIYFDQIFVRPDPDFQLQQSVYVLGEVITEGEYTKNARDERLSSLVGRANGVSELAYLEGAFLVRRNVGNVSIHLEKALRRPGSKYDLLLMPGDSLVVPMRTDAVSIVGNVLEPGTTVMFDKGNKRFKYYVRQAGGFARGTRKRDCTVQYVDGRVKRARRILLIRKYPRVEQGAVVVVAAKQEKVEKEESAPRERRDWTISPQEILSSAVALLTFVLLLDRATGN